MTNERRPACQDSARRSQETLAGGPRHGHVGYAEISGEMIAIGEESNQMAVSLGATERIAVG